MHAPIAQTLTGFALAVLMVLTPADAAAAAADEGGQDLRASAAVRGLDLNVFGRPLSLGSAGAALEGAPAAAAEAAGVALTEASATSVRAQPERRRQASERCLPEVELFDLVGVTTACGESRAQLLPELFSADFPRHLGASLMDPATARAESRPQVTDNGGPQAVGRGSVGAAAIGDLRPLRPATELLQSLLEALTSRGEQTVGSASTSVGPQLARVLDPLAASMGVGPMDSVRPVTRLLAQLVEGAGRSTGLVSIKLATSSATANTGPDQVTSLARTSGGEVDLLPGMAPSGAPLLSISFGPVESTSRFDRSTGARSSEHRAAPVRIRFNLPLAGAGVTEVEVRPGAPVTFLAGTPLETTIGLGGGARMTGESGSASFAYGASLQLLKGIGPAEARGLDLRLGHARSGTGDEPPLAGAGGAAPAEGERPGTGSRARDAAQRPPAALLAAVALALAANLAGVGIVGGSRRRRARRGIQP